MPQSTPTTLGKRRILATTTATLLLAASTFAEPPKVVEEFSGKVIGVTDGDTIKVLVKRSAVTVRLEGIDAPELGQSFGRKAKEALAKIVAGKMVTVRKTGNDKYDRTLGIVIVNGTDVNAKHVEDGWAWHFKTYNSDERLAKLKEAARTANRGLWADEAPLAPWDFRARQQALLAAPDEVKGQYWLNTSSGVRHNRSCEYFQKTKKGRFCGPDEGRPCGNCGG